MNNSGGKTMAAQRLGRRARSRKGPGLRMVEQLLQENEELRAALGYAASGLSLAADALEFGCVDEASLHIGHHHARVAKALKRYQE